MPAPEVVWLLFPVVVPTCGVLVLVAVLRTGLLTTDQTTETILGNERPVYKSAAHVVLGAIVWLLTTFVAAITFTIVVNSSLIFN